MRFCDRDNRVDCVSIVQLVFTKVLFKLSFKYTSHFSYYYMHKSFIIYVVNR